MTELSDYMRLVSGPQQEHLRDRIRDLSDALAASEAARERAEGVVLGVKLSAYPAHGSGFVAIVDDGGAELQALQRALVRHAGETGGGEHG